MQHNFWSYLHTKKQIHNSHKHTMQKKHNHDLKNPINVVITSNI